MNLFQRLIDWRNAHEQRMYRRWRSRIEIIDDAVVVRKRGRPDASIPRDSIVAVEMYKRDMLAVDDVCCDVFIEGDLFWTFNEEMSGWRDLLAWFETFPGFYKRWPEAVILPPFEECRTLVLDNRKPVYRAGRRGTARS